MPIGITVGYKNSNGEDIGEKLVPKEYLIDRYPELVNTFRFAGLWSWGMDDQGQLGNNLSLIRISSPVQTISGGANWKEISAGGRAASGWTAAIKTDGTLWAWGNNGDYQLGTNSPGTHRSSPVQTQSAGTNWKQISAGGGHATAIKTDGTLWLWGGNFTGELGDNTLVFKSSPVQTISGGTNWKLVSAGGYKTAAIKTNGTLWTWGDNQNHGALGDNTTNHRSSPVQTIAGGTNWKLVSCGLQNISAIKTDGTLWTWGSNQYGQLGDNTITSKSSPIQTIAGGTNWKQVSCSYLTIAAIKTDGTLWAWGYNGVGQLGDNTTIDKSSPVQTVSGGTNWKQVSTNTSLNISAIKTDGTLWLWGYNNSGQLGDNTTTSKSSPIQTVAGGTNWKQVSMGLTHCVAIRDNSDDYI